MLGLLIPLDRQWIDKITLPIRESLIFSGFLYAYWVNPYLHEIISFVKKNKSLTPARA